MPCIFETFCSHVSIPSPRKKILLLFSDRIVFSLTSKGKLVLSYNFDILAKVINLVTIFFNCEHVRTCFSLAVV